MERITKHEPQD